MSFLVALAAIGSAVVGARAECVSLATAAKDAGATGLLSALKSAASADSVSADLFELVNQVTKADDDDRVTVFAPTDAAFLEVSKLISTLDSKVLADVVLNHWVEWDINDLAEAAKDDEIRAVSEGDLHVEKSSTGALYIIPDGTEIKAKVVSKIETCVGVVHIVDAVLVPAAEDIEAEADDEQEDAVSVQDVDALRLAQTEQSGEIAVARRALLTGSHSWSKCGRRCRKRRIRHRKCRGKVGAKGRKCRRRRPRGTPRPPSPTLPPVGSYGHK